MADADHDPDFDLDEPGQQQQQQPMAMDDNQNEGAQVQKPSRKKKKRRPKQEVVEDGAAAQQEGMPDLANSAEQPQTQQDAGLPSIFAAPPMGSGRDAIKENPAIVEEDDLEISDSEAPDAEQAKKNLRKQAEKKRKAKKTKQTYAGVEEDLQVKVNAPQIETPQAVEMANLQANAQEQPVALQRPGLDGDDAAPESEADDSAINEKVQDPVEQTPGGIKEETKGGEVPQQQQQQFEEMKLPPIGGNQAPAGAANSEQMARQLQAAYDAEAAEQDDDDDEDDGGDAGRRRNRRGKKGRRRRRGEDGMAGQAMGLSDLDFRDNQDIELMSQDFSIEHFRKLIKKTFDDYYPLEYNKSTFDMDEYLNVVENMQLVEKFSKELEMNDQNILTMRNMPWLDLGELPVSYNTHKTEAFQVYLIPQDDLPTNMIVTYKNWRRMYDSSKVIKVYQKTKLEEKGIALEDITETLNKATELIEPYRGQLAFRNKIVKIVLGICALITLVIAISIGMSMGGNYWAPMLVVVIYLILVLVVITVFKYRSSYQMRMSQFLLSVYCRAENNRLYLKHGVEVRPGFTGKWIEFACLENNVVDEIIQMMRQRFLKPCLEQKAAIFDKQVMGQHGLIAEQQDIENQIMNEQQHRDGERDAVERAEVAAAVMESNPNDFSEEHDMSLQGMQANVNSQAAMAQYSNQPPGMPPSAIAGQPDGGKKNKKRKKKKGGMDDPDQYGQPS